jgi:SynChlorMet cassette radical SAM/SPASM protein ScmE
MKSSQNYSFQKTPKSASISITGACNLRCKYCFYNNEMEQLRDLKTEQWLAFFKTLSDLSVMDVSLTGGEVFTRKDLFELIDGIIANRMRYNLLSNGTLIDDKVIEKLSEGKRRQRLDYIQISIDGSRAEVHNLSRPDSFDGAMRGLKLLIKHAFPIAVRVTINKHNLHDLDHVAAMLLDELGLPAFGCNDAMPIGSGCRSDQEVSLNQHEKLEAMRIMKRLDARYPGRIQAAAGPLAKLKMYDEMERTRRGEAVQTNWQMGSLSACGCIYQKIDILHDGSIVPCCMLPELKLGNILTDSLLEIWQTHPTLDALRNRRSIPMTEVQGCQTCEWNRFCNGSCPGMAHQLTHDFNRANPEDCLRMFLKANNLKEFSNAL